MRRSSIAETFPITAFLLLFVVAFFVLELIVSWKIRGELPAIGLGGIDPRATWLLGHLQLEFVKDGEYWRLIAAAFLHGGIVHILFNGIVLWDMGRICEPFLSSWKFLVVYVCSALGSSGLSLLYSQYVADGPRYSVGASGALAGLIGMLLVYSIRSGNRELRDSLSRWIFMIIVLSLIVGSVDHSGHLGGFLTGGAFGFTLDRYIGSRAAARWRLPGYVAAIVCAISLGMAVMHYLSNRALFAG